VLMIPGIARLPAVSLTSVGRSKSRFLYTGEKRHFRQETDAFCTCAANIIPRKCFRQPVKFSHSALTDYGHRGCMHLEPPRDNFEWMLGLRSTSLENLHR